MSKKRPPHRSLSALPRAMAVTRTYDATLSRITELIAEGRQRAARAINAEMVATYWLVGRYIVEEEQRGAKRASYGDELVARLAQDLTKRFGRGFGKRNLFRMKSFYLLKREIVSTVPAQLDARKKVSTASTLSTKVDLQALSSILLLPWSHYVLLLAVRNEHARRFYEIEALRGGWSIRQLARQIDTQFYERCALSRNKVAMLAKGARSRPSDEVTPEEEIRDRWFSNFLI